MFTGRLCGGIPARSCPAIEIEPAEGVSKPANMRIRVVLPQPDGPRSAKNSRSKMSSDTLLTAVKLPKFFETFSIRISGFAEGSSHGANLRRIGPIALAAITDFPRSMSDERKGRCARRRPFYVTCA